MNYRRAARFRKEFREECKKPLYGCKVVVRYF